MRPHGTRFLALTAVAATAAIALAACSSSSTTSSGGGEHHQGPHRYRHIALADW